MRCIVRRTSQWAFDKDNPPCEGAYVHPFVYTDVRTFATPEEFDAKLAAREGPWLSKGTNHRIVDGMIARDTGTREHWCVDVDDVWEFARRVGHELVLSFTKPSDTAHPSIEIYDDYRE